jgi:putative phosphoribosyl transferase
VIFHDRAHAGRLLAERLGHLRNQDPVVLALPRGGVPVAAEIARALDAPLDVLIVRKLGAPSQPELALGAVGEGGVKVLNEDLLARAGLSPDVMPIIEAREFAEIDRRRDRYRGDRAMVPLTGRTAIIVDDGLATGATARAGISVVRARGAARVVVAIPVGAPDSIRAVAREADEVVALAAPPQFAAVGAWYDDFRQVRDDEVIRMLAAAAPPASDA